MTGPPGSHRSAGAALLLIAAAIAATGALDLTRGHLVTAATAFGSAAMACVAGFLLRLNWRLIELNRALIDQNARLIARGIREHATNGSEGEEPW